MEEKTDEEEADEDAELPTGALGAVAKAAAKAKDMAELIAALHSVMHGSLNKGAFAASIFEKLSSGEPVVCPKYISDALDWLQELLEPSKEPAA